jgi:zinc finger FYVE domain-containing protein 1
MISSSKGAMDNIPYLTCLERVSCSEEMTTKATFYCQQCNSLQCVTCEKEIHQDSDKKKHDRLNLDEVDDEYCSVNKNHQAVFYCPTCALAFCYSCYETRHQHSDGKEHKPQKCREGQLLTSKKNT